LIEALVLMFIFSIITVTFYSVFSLGMRYIIESKNRLGALALANEKMEIVRNLNYDQIGTTGGVPDGDIPEAENLTVNTRTYQVKTLVKLVDDPLDDVAPDDEAPNDYKSVKITVSWEGGASQNSQVVLISNFSPPSLETSSGKGILSVNIVDSTGAPVSQATVHMINNSLTPAIDTTQATNNNGNIMFLEMLPAISSYELTVSKDGYEIISTVDPNSVFYTPVDSNASVVEGFINSKSIVIDKVSDLKIKSEKKFHRLM